VLPPPTFSADWGTRGVGEEEADWGGGKEVAIGEGAEAAGWGNGRRQPIGR
jgi:hypothetical protein